MFTGIVEEKGRVKNIITNSQGGNIEVNCQKVLEETVIGDSIAINGVCLTVTKIGHDAFTADVMSETLAKTALNSLKKGSWLNLERALTLNSRLGGHIVSGHIDGVGKILQIEDNGIAVLLQVATDQDITDYIVTKGSVAIDGISLTVVDVWPEAFSVSLIPHTFRTTNLCHKGPGDLVNLETDIIGKYVHKLMGLKNEKKESVTAELLRENGFF